MKKIISNKHICVLSILSIILFMLTYNNDYCNFLRINTFFGVIFSIFVPGLLLFLIFKIKTKQIIFSFSIILGLGLINIMMFGLLNHILYITSLLKKVNIALLFIEFSVYILFLLLIFIITRPNYSVKIILIKINNTKKLNYIYLIIVLCSTIFGTYLLNEYDINYFIAITLILIGIYPIIFNFIRNDHNNILTLYVLSLCLLWHWSLISSYLTGADVHYEYYYAKLSLENGYWNVNIPSNLNSMLSIVILPVYISIFSKISIIYVFKIIYPMIFALVPINLYKLFIKYFSDKLIFYSIIYFIFISSFYNEMSQLPRQQIAEFFLVLILVILGGNVLSKNKSSLLMIIFIISIVVSHYGLSYLLIIIFISYIIIKKIFEKPLQSCNNINLSKYLVAIFVIFIFLWYSTTSNSNLLKNITTIGSAIIYEITNDIFNTKTQGALLITYNPTFFHSINKYMILFSQLLIFIGILIVLFKKKYKEYNLNFLYLSLSMFLILVMSLTLPFFASSINITRIYHISLIVLSPLFLIGLEFIIDKIHLRKYKYNITSIYLILFLLLNSGFIYHYTNDNPNSIALDDNIDFPIYTEGDQFGSLFLYYYSADNQTFNSDIYSKYLIHENFPYYWNGSDTVNNNFGNIQNGTLIYLRHSNVNSFKLYSIIKIDSISHYDYIDIDLIIKEENKIYSNADSIIFYVY